MLNILQIIIVFGVIFGLFYFKIGEGIPTASYPNLVDLDWSIESF